MAKRKLSVAMSRDDILNAKDVQVIEKSVKAWGNQIVHFRQISGADGLAFNEYIELVKKDNPEISNKTTLLLGIRLLTYTLCDEQGNLLFTEDDIEALSHKSMLALKELIQFGMEVSGVDEKAISEATDKLKNAPSDSSPSNLQES